MMNRTLLRALRPIVTGARRAYGSAPTKPGRKAGSALIGASVVAIGAGIYGIAPLDCSSGDNTDAVKKDIIALMEAEVLYFKLYYIRDE